MNFLKSQHTQRKCILVEKGVESEKFEIPLIGVPQGEPNSPNSFSIIINGVFDYAKKDEIRPGQIHVQGFADDTGSGIKGKKGTSERRQNRISFFKNAVAYTDSCGFKLNPSKTEMMLIRTDKNNSRATSFETPYGEIKNKD